MDNFNTKIEELKKNIGDTINESELPIGVVYYLLKDIFSEVTIAYNKALVIEEQVQLINKDDKE